MLERLSAERDVGLQMAFASALGKLGATGAVDRLLELLRDSTTHDARMEFSLALARLAGEEHRFVQLLRRAESEPGTAFSQEATALRARLVKARSRVEDAAQALDAAAEALAREDLVGGLALLAGALRIAIGDEPASPCRAVVEECAYQMECMGAERIEYAVLGLHAVECAAPGDDGLL
jgi:hypothetical protein